MLWCPGCWLCKRHIDVQNTLSNCECNAINHVYMTPDGTLLSCTAKSEIIHALKELAVSYIHKVKEIK